MNSLKRTIFESIIFFGSFILLIILFKQGSFPNMSESVYNAIRPISIVLIIGLFFVVLISYLKYREIKHNPKSKEVFEIFDTDERNIYLKDKTNSKAYYIFNTIELPLSLILLFAGFDEFATGLIIFHFIKEGVRALIYLNLSKKY